MTCNTRLRVIRAISKSRTFTTVGSLALLLFVSAPTQADILLAANQHQPQQNAQTNNDDQTPEQRFQKRFPQAVRVGHLIGLPVLDDNDSTIGYVRRVVRSPGGKISLIVPYSAWFGWARCEWGKRPVAVPIETVTILARQLDSVDMAREDYDDAPTWMPAQGQSIQPDEQIQIALGRR
jgi:hypothetical protein